MGHMEDKDFDQLFKDQFAEAEVAPSANLWAGIEKELLPRKRVVLPGYWMAAAVVIVAVMVGVLMPKSEPIRLRGSAEFVANNLNTPTIEPSKAVDAVVVEEVKVESTPLIIAARLNENDVKKDFEAMQPIAVRKHPFNMVVENAPAVVAKVEPEVPADDRMIARVEAPQDVTATAEAEQHKGIRNVGDLVNMVVNKVDKRDKKLIQFNTDEDDNSSLIAINIGFFRFNKRDK